MRLLFIIGNYKPAINSGGPVNSVSSLAEALSCKGHSVTVLALNEDDGVPMQVPLRELINVNGVSVIYFERVHGITSRIRQKITLVARWESALYDWLRVNITEFDGVHLQIGLLHPAGWVARLSEDRGVPLAYHQRGNLDSRRFGRLRWLKSWYIRFIEVPVLKRADVLFALSQRESDVYRLWSSNERIQSLPNGVDAAFWSAGLLDRQSSKELSAPGRVRRVIWSARWDLRKGPLEFIEMAKCVSKLLPKVQFVMLGPARGASLAVVEAAAAASGLENLTLMKGLDAASRREQLQAADFFVLPTDGEGFSLGILEALAAGCVVLTTDEANFPELRDQCFGHIIKKDPQLFANVLVELLGSAEAMNASIRSKASAFVRKNYDWSSITDRYIKIMASTLDE